VHSGKKIEMKESKGFHIMNNTVYCRCIKLEMTATVKN